VARAHEVNDGFLKTAHVRAVQVEGGEAERLES
jgi:hypothetical protein